LAVCEAVPLCWAATPYEEGDEVISMMFPDLLISATIVFMAKHAGKEEN
jgi:hypothetical protein